MFSTTSKYKKYLFGNNISWNTVVFEGYKIRKWLKNVSSKQNILRAQQKHILNNNI